MKAKVNFKEENIQRISPVHEYSKDEEESDWEKARNLYYSNACKPEYYKKVRLKEISHTRGKAGFEIFLTYLFFYCGVHLCSMLLGNGVYFLLLAASVLVITTWWPNIKDRFFSKWLNLQSKKKMLL